MSLFDPNNPDAEKHLRRLAESMPAMAIRQTRRGLQRDQQAKFTRCCPVCNEFFRHARSKIIQSEKMQAENCPACAKQLQAGFTALVTASHRHAFARIGGEAAGKVQVISETEFNVFRAREAAQDIWNVMVKHCGAAKEGVVGFFEFALKNERPFKYTVGPHLLCFSAEGVPSVEWHSGDTNGLEDVNKAMLELLEK